MDQNSENDKKSSDSSKQEQLGAYLKRAREAIGLDLNEVSREVKISVEFLKALESNNFKILPGDAYIRAYIKTLAQRYSLNQEKLLDWYLEETGQRKLESSDEMINVKLSETDSQKSKPPIALIFLILIIVVVIIFMNRMNKQENLNLYQNQSTSESIGSDTVPSDVKIGAESAEDTLHAEQIEAEDSTLDALLSADSIKTHGQNKNSTTVTTTPEKKKAVKSVLEIDCKKDSTWIQVLRTNEEPWARMIREGMKSYTVTSMDTMKIRLGAPERAILTLNKKSISINKINFKIYNGKVIP